jgi:hypothetical protein
MQRKQAQLLSVVIIATGLLLGGCRNETPRLSEVSVDFDRALQHYPGAQAITLLQRQATALNDWQTPVVNLPESIAVRLPAVDTPPPTDLFVRRRQQALQALQEQRDAVRLSMLDASLKRLEALERIWRKEIENGLDFNPIRQTWLEEWRALFEHIAAQLFPLMVERELYSPVSEKYKALTAQIQAIEQEWMNEELALQAKREQQIARLKDEAEVMLGIRAREFINQAEQEVSERLRDQPALVNFAPPASRKHETAEHSIHIKTPKPSKSIGMSAKVEHLSIAWQEKMKEHLQELAKHWAEQNHYRLTKNRSVSDKTNEFILFLKGR